MEDPKKNILSELDDFIPCREECYDDDDDTIRISFKDFKNLYLYVTEKQLFSILEDKALKLSRTERTNDATENIYSGETFVSPLVREYGYICLSSSITSPMMWGQYADRGKGACLVFSLKLFAQNNNIDVEYYFDRTQRKIGLFSKNIVMRKVLYALNRITNKGNTHYDIMSTKYLGWEHEKEFRIILPLNDARQKEDQGGNDPFSYIYLDDKIMPALSRVVLGVNSSLDEYDTERKINNALMNDSYPKCPVRVVRASLNPSTFCISPNLDNIHPHLVSR